MKGDRLPAAKSRRVETCHQPLSCSLFITCGAIDLARQVKAGQAFYGQVRRQFARIDIVVFDGVAEAPDLDILKARGSCG